jgi:endoglucanase
MLRSRFAVSMLASAVMVVSSLGGGAGLAASAMSRTTATTSWLHTDGSRIVTDSGDDFTIRAVNWFGMETSNCAPHGLWQISLDQAMDQIASFGFTTIRLPYSSECVGRCRDPRRRRRARREPALARRRQGCRTAADGR